MKPKLSLAGLNRLRMAIALAAGAMAAGISVLGRSSSSGSALVDGTLLSALWIYIGVTAVPWASLKGMPGSSVTSALTMVTMAVYLGAATAFAGWSVAENPAWREEPRAAPQGRCVPDPEAAPDAPAANVANHPSRPVVVPEPPVPPRVPPRPREVPVPVPVPASPAPDAAVRAPEPVAPAASPQAPEAAAPDASAREASQGDAGAEELEGRHRRGRHHRHGDDEEEDDSRPPPAVWLERDPAVPSGRNN